MGKAKPPKGYYRQSINDGSSVTVSVLKRNPLDGLGNNSKPFATRFRRHYFHSMMREAKRNNQPEAIPDILDIYRKEG